MNSELVRQALEKVSSPHELVNMVSQRVRQLNAGMRGPLIANAGSLSLADIALTEIIEDKMGFDMPEIVKLIRPTAQNRKRPQSWGKMPTEKKAA